MQNFCEIFVLSKNKLDTTSHVIFCDIDFRLDDRDRTRKLDGDLKSKPSKIMLYVYENLIQSLCTYVV